MQKAILQNGHTLGFKCPACDSWHSVPVRPIAGYIGPVWGWNDSLESPTLTPSVNNQWGKYADPNWEEPAEGGGWSGRCHFFLVNGSLQYCGDCTHSMAGQTVEAPILKEWEIRD